MRSLKQMRIDVGLSQKNVSDALEYGTAQLVSNFERGISYPPKKDLIKLAELYNVDAEEFLKNYIKEKVGRYERRITKDVMGSFKSIPKNKPSRR